MLKIGTVLAVAALIIAALSLLIGSGLSYVTAQLCALTGLAAFVAISDRIPLVVSVMVIATLAKNFAISQVIKILLWQPADVGLGAPVMTAWVMAVGTLGCLVAASAYIIVVKPAPSRALLAQPLPPDMLSLLGWTFTTIGLACRAIALFPQANVVFYYASALSYTGAAVFALQNKITAGKVLDLRVLFVLGAGLLLGLPLQSKTAILLPFALIAILYISLRTVPHWLVIAGAALSFVSVVYILHPIVNHARGHGMSSLEAVVELAGNPSEWDTVEAESDSTEARWVNRLYYGRPMGFINRFTPNQIDDLVVIQPYSDLKFGSYLSRSLRAVLPQTFGYSREVQIGQSQLEGAFQRKNVLGTNFANYGLFADLFLFGGFANLFVGMVAIIGLQMILYTMVFGTETNAVLSLSYGIISIFYIADSSLASFLINMVHGAIIIWGASALILLVAAKAARASTVRSRVGGRDAAPEFQ
jgi:hypothetical protein